MSLFFLLIKRGDVKKFCMMWGGGGGGGRGDVKKQMPIQKNILCPSPTVYIINAA